MHIGIKYLTLKLPIPWLVWDNEEHTDITELHTPKPIGTEPGDIVMTKNGLDIGLVVETKNGSPTRIWARYDGFPINGSLCNEYGAVEMTTWCKTGRKMTQDGWIALCTELKDAQGFHDYWDNQLKAVGPI